MRSQMTHQEASWRADLQQLFAASVNQQTLEEAAELMVSVSATEPNYHAECLTLLDAGIDAAMAHDEAVIPIINKSGYQVVSTAEAAELLQEFKAIYLKEFDRVTGKNA